MKCCTRVLRRCLTSGNQSFLPVLVAVLCSGSAPGSMDMRPIPVSSDTEQPHLLMPRCQTLKQNLSKSLSEALAKALISLFAS